MAMCKNAIIKGDSSQEQIILAIAFIKQYPTFEQYISKKRDDKSTPDDFLRNRYDSNAAICEVALANNYKMP
jgi:hypothetical protein